MLPSVRSVAICATYCCVIQESLQNVDFQEASEAAEACGLTFRQLQALISSQVHARVRAFESNEEEELAQASTATVCPEPIAGEQLVPGQSSVASTSASVADLSSAQRGWMVPTQGSGRDEAQYAKKP